MNRARKVAAAIAVTVAAVGGAGVAANWENEPSPDAAASVVPFNPCPPQHEMVLPVGTPPGGETFTQIATRLGVDARKLADANGTTAGSRPSLTTKRLAGSCIIVPSSPPTTTTPTSTTTSLSSTTIPSPTSSPSATVVSVPSPTSSTTTVPASTATTTTTLSASSTTSAPSTVPSTSTSTTIPAGNDDWLFTGDSITSGALYGTFDDQLEALVRGLAPGRTPNVIDVSIGGTTTATATAIIDSQLAAFSGRYVVLGYGTNDYIPDFKMETLIQKVIAKGKIPVVPYMPWSTLEPWKGPLVNPLIEALYVKYPQVVRGPNLYAAFLNRPDLFSGSDVHPNPAGSAHWRFQWAQVMAAVGSVPPPPTPPTTTIPAPTTTTTIVPSGVLTPIADNFTVAGELVAESGPNPNSDEGKFRTECTFSHLNYDDPIVYPNNPGQAHLHTYFGNKGANAASTYESLRTTGESTCAGGKLNRSAYWAPAMLDAAGKVRVFETVTVYYACSGFPSCQSFQELPPGLKMISGFDMANTAANAENVKHYRWFCTNAADVEVRSGGAVMPVCNVGENLYVRMEFPGCWDGQRVDSANHRDHMAHADYRKGFLDCPPGYPVRVPVITLQIRWKVTGTSTATWKLASDTMPGMSHLPGETWHSDWFGAWSPPIMTQWMNGCVRPMDSCVFSQIGNYQGSTKRLKEPAPYTGSKVLDPPPIG